MSLKSFLRGRHEQDAPTVERRIVTDRIFLLGLDRLYREAMKTHEREELLWCARSVARELDVAPADVPVEGYYAEEEPLTEYFRLMRALQKADANVAPRVASLLPFQRLLAVTSAPLYGHPVFNGRLLPAGRDPLTQALDDTKPDWALETLVAAAGRVARESDDISLVGLAARAQDAVVLAATRESVILYAGKSIGGMTIPRPIEYTWAVDEDMSRHARRFIDAFNELFDERLPAPDSANAEPYWRACRDNRIHCRCVHLGWDDRTQPVSHYHWVILEDSMAGYDVRDFWSAELWTTARYASAYHDQSQARPPGSLRFGTCAGASRGGAAPRPET